MRRAALLFPIGLLLLLMSCSAGDRPPPPSSSAPVPGAGTQTTPAAASSSPATSEAPPTIVADGHAITGWVSPNGAVACVGNAVGAATVVHCEVTNAEWTAPGRPKECPVEYGWTLSVEAGLARFSCAGDPAYPSALLGQDGTWWPPPRGPAASWRCSRTGGRCRSGTCRARRALTP